jgi:hypothetical protein
MLLKMPTPEGVPIGSVGNNEIAARLLAYGRIADS